MRNHKRNQKGFIVSLELILIAVILTMGLIVGLVAVRDAMAAELKDLADEINSINNSYSFAGILYQIQGNTVASIAGSSFDDQVDMTSGQNGFGDVTYTVAASPE